MYCVLNVHVYYFLCYVIFAYKRSIAFNTLSICVFQDKS